MKNKMTGACYKCEYRGTIPGDAHSCCNHPLVKDITGGTDMFSAIIGMVDNTEGIVQAAKKLNLQANSHGVQSGWFMWPANFDPAWLENCDGFTEKE